MNLFDVRVGGWLVFAPVRLEHTTDPQARLGLDGLTYAGRPLKSAQLLGEISVDTGCACCVRAPRRMRRSRTRHFASAHRAAGNDGGVRKILIAQRRDQVHRGGLGGRDRLGMGDLGDPGLRLPALRALLFLIAVAITSVILALTLGGQGGLARTDPQPPTATQCSVVERIAVGLDFGLPLVKTGTPAHCEPTTSPSGQVLTVAGWGLQLLAWAFATLFVAGFTGAVRKT